MTITTKPVKDGSGTSFDARFRDLGGSIFAPEPSILGRTGSVSVTPTITSGSAYAAGNAVGGLLTFTNILDEQKTGIVQSIMVRALSVQPTGLKLYLFEANPTASTFTDKTAPSINSADISKVRGPFPLSAYDSGLGTHTQWELNGIGAAIAGATQTLYGLLVTTGAPNYTSTSGITVSLVVLKD